MWRVSYVVPGTFFPSTDGVFLPCEHELRVFYISLSENSIVPTRGIALILLPYVLQTGTKGTVLFVVRHIQLDSSTASSRIFEMW